MRDIPMSDPTDEQILRDRIAGLERYVAELRAELDTERALAAGLRRDIDTLTEIAARALVTSIIRPE